MSTREKCKDGGKRTKDPICGAGGVEARPKALELAQRGNPYLCHLLFKKPCKYTFEMILHVYMTFNQRTN
jgi:hypothetical protein